MSTALADKGQEDKERGVDFFNLSLSRARAMSWAGSLESWGDTSRVPMNLRKTE